MSDVHPERPADEVPPPPAQAAPTPEVEWRRLDQRMLLVNPVQELIRFFPLVIGALVLGSGEDNFWQLLGIAIPVGKDSMSMRTVWRDAKTGEARAVVAPLTLVATAFAPVTDVRLALTPELRPHADAPLYLVDLGAGRNRLGGSALCQVYSTVGAAPPDVDEPARLKSYFRAIQALVAEGALWAYHDRGDGGLFVTLVEMAFAGNCGYTSF